MKVELEKELLSLKKRKLELQLHKMGSEVKTV